MRAAAARINEWMNESGMTQQTLADHVGLSQQAIGKFLRGKNATSLDHLAAMAEALGRSLSDVFAEKSPKPTAYSILVSSWNSLPTEKHRQTLLKLTQEWVAATTGRGSSARH
jgi:transcriptional regulator with XRE-family HTH domain